MAVSRLVRKANARLYMPVPEFALRKRREIIEALLAEPEIAGYVDKRPADEREAHLNRARRYAREIGPRFSAFFYFRLGRFLARTLLRMHYRIRVVDLENGVLSGVPSNATVVLVSNHRSNFDPLVITYLASERSTIALSAGEWARLWPLHHLVRAAGGFVVDRSADDELYKRVLAAYIRVSARSGLHQAVFPEGELSRDGRMGRPKLGYLSYICRACTPERDIVFIPVGINYDRIPEDRRLAYAESGFGNPKASFLILSSLRYIATVLALPFRRRSHRFGHAGVSFGVPLSLKGWLDSRGVDVADLDVAGRHEWLPDLAGELMHRSSRRIPVPPVPLAAAAIAGHPERPSWDEASLSEANDRRRAPAGVQWRIRAPAGGHAVSRPLCIADAAAQQAARIGRGRYIQGQRLGSDGLATLRQFDRAFADMNISRWIYWWADRMPDQVAIRFDGADVTYSALAQEVDRTACALQELGILKGHRIAWLGFNSADFLGAFFACARIGAVMVPLNFRLAPREHLFIIRNAGARMLVFDPRLAETAELIESKLPDCRLVSLANVEARSSHASLPELKQASDGKVSGDLVHPRNPLCIVYTSGTTGRPKGAVLTQRTIHWNGLNSQFMHDLHREDRVLTALPFFHVGGLNIQTTPALQVGATVMLSETFDAGAFLAMVANDRPTLTALVPTQMQAIASHPDWQDADLSSLRCITTGSTMVPMPLLEEWHRHDIPVIQIYGCTESGPIAIHQVMEAALTSAGSVGRPAIFCDVRLVDDDGRDVADGESGEILLRGPNLLREYWQDAEATEAAFDGDWLRTGDIGMRDDDGNYHVVDRKKRVIISGGENIYPSELERVLQEHPEVTEAFVVGVPHDKWGEVPVAAFEYAGDSAPQTESLAAMFEGRLGHMKHPRHFLAFEGMPRNAMGKVIAADLRAQVLERLTGNQSPS